MTIRCSDVTATISVMWARPPSLPHHFDEYVWFDRMSAIHPIGAHGVADVPDTYPFRSVIGDHRPSALTLRDILRESRLHVP